MKNFQKYFSRVNHVYYKDHTQLHKDLANQMMEKKSDDDNCLDIIDHLKYWGPDILKFEKEMLHFILT